MPIPHPARFDAPNAKDIAARAAFQPRAVRQQCDCRTQPARRANHIAVVTRSVENARMFRVMRRRRTVLIVVAKIRMRAPRVLARSHATP